MGENSFGYKPANLFLRYWCGACWCCRRRSPEKLLLLGQRIVGATEYQCCNRGQRMLSWIRVCPRTGAMYISQEGGAEPHRCGSGDRGFWNRGLHDAELVGSYLCRYQTDDNMCGKDNLYIPWNLLFWDILSFCDWFIETTIAVPVSGISLLSQDLCNLREIREARCNDFSFTLTDTETVSDVYELMTEMEYRVIQPQPAV